MLVRPPRERSAPNLELQVVMPINIHSCDEIDAAEGNVAHIAIAHKSFT